MSPVFSPDGSRIAYTAQHGRDWDTWAVPVLGGEPRLWLPNASGLVWIDKSKLLFSEIKDQALHMAIVTAEESRAGSRDLYVPPHERGMAHRSYPSPDGKSILVVEMNERGGFGPCRLVPVGRQVPGKAGGPSGRGSARLPHGRPMGNGCTSAPARAAPFIPGVSVSPMASRSRSPRDRRKRKGSPWRPTAARSLRLSE